MKDTKKEILISLIKSGLSAIPYAGGVLNEILFDGRSRLEQGRLNKFIEHLKDLFETDGERIDFEKMKSDDFSDLLIGVMDKARRTGSQDKLIRYKNIIANYLLYEITDLDNYMVFLNLVETTSEVELRVLVGISDHVDKYYSQAANRYFQDDRVKREAWYNMTRFLKASHYDLNEETFMFCKQSLSAKALLIEKGIGSFDYEPFFLMSTTEFGKSFLEFIINRNEPLQ